LRPIAEPRVELVEDASVRAGFVRAEARFVDLAPAAKTEVETAAEGTRQLRLADLASARRRPSPAAAATDVILWLVDSLGEGFALEPQAGIVRVGRGADNDLVLSNQRVSRYHAQLRWVESGWLVYDLDSTNGTWVDQQRVLPSQPRELTLGAALRLGDHELRARRDSAPLV
ncbi:MAG: FHA domain-containing protein, partial [Chloroflexota bacterium]|nr:FHA domain-containing protein [Chloroflexota bacterium]